MRCPPSLFPEAIASVGFTDGPVLALGSLPHGRKLLPRAENLPLNLTLIEKSCQDVEKKNMVIHLFIWVIWTNQNIVPKSRRQLGRDKAGMKSRLE